MTTQITLSDQWAATNLLTGFYRALDERNLTALSTLMHPECVWWRKGVPCQNEEEIRASLANRSLTMRIHHILTNLNAQPVGECIEVTAYMLVIQYDDGSERDGEAPLTGIKNVRTTRATARRWGDSWRLSLLKSDPLSFAAHT